MNYFEFYNIPISFKVDNAALKKIFYQNSKKYHPDFYTLEGEEKQQEVLQLSSLNNEAFQVLKNFDKRMKYILDLKGVLSEEGKNQIPQDFLMEMMDFNEAIMEMEFEPNPEKLGTLHKDLETLEKQLFSEVESIVENYSEETATELELNSLKEYYLIAIGIIRQIESNK